MSVPECALLDHLTQSPAVSPGDPACPRARSTGLMSLFVCVCACVWRMGHYYQLINHAQKDLHGERIHESVSLFLSYTQTHSHTCEWLRAARPCQIGSCVKRECGEVLVLERSRRWSGVRGNRWLQAAFRLFFKLQCNSETLTCQTEMLFWESSARQTLVEERLLKSLVHAARRPDQAINTHTHNTHFIHNDYGSKT